MSRKSGMLGVLAAVALLVVALTGSALAAPPTPTPGTSNYGVGYLDQITLKRVATLLGTTPEDVIGKLQQGQTLAQIAQAREVTSQALTDTLLQPVKDQLDLQVKYGYLNQDDANTRLEEEQNRVSTIVNTAIGQNGNNGYGYGQYGGGMMGGFGGTMGSSGWGGLGGMMNGFGGFMNGFGNMMSGLGSMMGGFGGATGNSGNTTNGFGGMMGGSGGRGMMGR
ncbi:MAG: hypothetical protein Q8R28_12330 [Dehalococcoidia bacterium]|nr:hypothetical protein [Dehalococcoidia bacterium]